MIRRAVILAALLAGCGPSRDAVQRQCEYEAEKALVPMSAYHSERRARRDALVSACIRAAGFD